MPQIHFNVYCAVTAFCKIQRALVNTIPAQRKLNFARGFTLIEVLVVLAIVAILALLAIPSKTAPITQTYIKQNMNLVDDYKGLIVSYYKLNLQFPPDNESIGLPEPEKIRGNYMTQVVIEDGAINIVMGNKINPAIHGKILSLRPIYVDESPLSPVSWVCGYDTAPKGMLVSGENYTNVDSKYLPLGCH